MIVLLLFSCLSNLHTSVIVFCMYTSIENSNKYQNNRVLHNYYLRHRYHHQRVYCWLVSRIAHWRHYYLQYECMHACLHSANRIFHFGFVCDAVYSTIGLWDFWITRCSDTEQLTVSRYGASRKFPAESKIWYTFNFAYDPRPDS